MCLLPVPILVGVAKEWMIRKLFELKVVNLVKQADMEASYFHKNLYIFLNQGHSKPLTS